MMDFIKENKKKIKLGIIVFLIFLLISMVWLFILPSFKSNKYGNRLKEEKKYIISNKTISKIKDKAKDSDSVSKIDYHKEGRILNFTVTVDSNLGVDQAKEFASSIISEIDKDSLKYYDVQILIDSDGENYPIIGYKSKKSDGLSYGNVGE